MYMRFLILVKVPTTAGNELMKDATGVKTIEDYLNQLKPEAVYFTELFGDRVFVLVADLPSPDVIPKVAEPMFKLGFRVEFHVAMKLEDLKKAFQA